MIELEKRNAIYQLYKEGLSLRRISKQLNVSRNTVIDIIHYQAEGMPPPNNPKRSASGRGEKSKV